MRKLKLFTLLAGIFLATSMWADPVAIDATCGLSWEITDGTLTITYDGEGTGLIPNKSFASAHPWYNDRTSITSIVLPSGLVQIGNNAFNGCQITSISLPNTLTTIGQNAFQFCSELVSIEIPASVTNIGTSTGMFSTTVNAFTACSKLESITFHSTTPLTNIQLPTNASLKIYVPDEAAQAYVDAWVSYSDKLYYASDGTKVAVHDEGTCGPNLTWDFTNGVLTISGTGAMSDYESAGEQPWKDYRSTIKSVVVEEGVTTIGSYAFRACTKMTSVSLPEGLTIIGVSAFQGDDNASFTTITFPSTLTNIGIEAFKGCTSIATIYANADPDHLTWNDNGCNDFISSSTIMVTVRGEKITKCYVSPAHFYGYMSMNTGSITGVDATDINVTFVLDTPVESGDCSVELYSKGVDCETGMVVSGNGAMEDYADLDAQPWAMSGITTIVIEEGVTHIGSHAFDGCVNVTSIQTKPATAPTLGTDAFKDHLATVEISAYPCSGYASYVSAWSDFASSSFVEDCSPANSCGDGLTWEYNSTTNALTISYDGSGTGIMNDYTETAVPWYDNRTSIKSISLPEGMTHIGNNAFNSCRNAYLTSIAIPSTVTSIGEWAFYSCYNLTSLTLPAGLTSIGENAFDRCSEIASAITIPSGVTVIPAGAFRGCEKIPSVTLPSGLTSIGSSAFMSCNALTEVTIPASVTEIGVGAFSPCNALETVHCLPTTAPTLRKDAFGTNPANLAIYYPNGSDQDYANKFLQYWDCLRNASTSAAISVLPHLHNVFGDASLEWDLSFTGSGTLMEHVGTLALSGTGAMDDYNYRASVHAPWYDYADFINHVNIASGVTRIGDCAFYEINHVNTFIIPATVTYIGGDAFYLCNNTEMIIYMYCDPDNLEWHDNIPYYENLKYAPDDFLSLTRDSWGRGVRHVNATKCVVPEAYLATYKSKWARGTESPDHYLDVNVWFTSEIQDGETESAISTKLAALNGQTAPAVTLVRPLNLDGYFATICLPFNMSADQLAESSLHGAEIKEFTDATVDGGTLNIEFSPVTEIVAGRPYFIKFTNPEDLGDALDRIDFMDVTINNTTPAAVTHGGLTMTGTFVPKAVSVQTSATDGDGVLFLGANNSLFWPNVAGNIKPFRAYFSIASGPSNAPLRRGMPARIVEKEQTPTGIENKMVNGKCQNGKYLENGMLIIEKNGVRYNAQGQIVK